MGSEAKNNLYMQGGIALSIILSMTFCLIIFITTSHAQTLPNLDRVLDSQEDILKEMQSQLTWIKVGCGGVITALCGVIGILFRTTQKQQSAIIYEVKNSLRIKEEIMLKFAEIHEENLRNSELNREESERKRDVLNHLTDAINCLPCITGQQRDLIAHVDDCPAR